MSVSVRVTWTALRYESMDAPVMTRLRDISMIRCFDLVGASHADGDSPRVRGARLERHYGMLLGYLPPKRA